MNNIEIEDFYHHDFTTASEWEVFIARLEELMHEWKLIDRKLGYQINSGDFVACQWSKKSEKLHFADAEFILRHFKLELDIDNDDAEGSKDDSDEEQTQCQKDAMDMSNDFVRFGGEHSEIALYYGTREFLVLVPSKRDVLADETRIKILLSSLTIATTNANCEIPILVQVQEPSQEMYLGISIGKTTCTHFDMVHLKKVPPHCRYLNGLLALFKQKIGEGCGVRFDPVTISARFSYKLSDWGEDVGIQGLPNVEFLEGEILDPNELGKLPFGVAWEPLTELELFATWPEMSENVVVDSEGVSDLDAQLAPEWSVKVRMRHTDPSCLLSGNYFHDFLRICKSQETMADLLGEAALFTNADEQLFSSAFSALTDSRIPTISTVVGKVTSRKSQIVEGPIAEDIMSQILYFLFPDADEQMKSPYGDLSTYTADDDQWIGVKTCAIDSLVWRLAIVAVHCSYKLSDHKALAHLWYEFVQEIRFRWERSISIPGVGPGFPDCVRTCILHQKLQMLNCCIEKKKARQESAHKPQTIEIDDFDTAESDEDEFFECNSDEGAGEEETTKPPKAKHLLWNRPAGRLAMYPSQRLIQTGDALYIPITQDPVPKTEDQLEEDARVMMQLGTDTNASKMRARMMSASLLSDMESFKAANPGAVLEDFIRWYSPRDWIEENELDEWKQQKGHLSERMLIPNNPWSTCWASAQPVPAHRQKRLFDDTREAEKALHFLSSKQIAQVAQLLLPTLTHAAIYTLSQQKHEALPTLPDVIGSMLSELRQLTKPIQPRVPSYEKLVRDMEEIEKLVSQVNFLEQKLGGGKNNSKEFTSFLVSLMRGKEVQVPGGPRGDVGSRIAGMFRGNNSTYTTFSNQTAEAAADSRHKSFPEPTRKEFILRTIYPRPSPSSTPQPQRLYACLQREYIRLAGFFSEDTVFL